MLSLERQPLIPAFVLRARIRRKLYASAHISKGETPMSTILEIPKGIAIPAITPTPSPVQLLSGLGGAIGSDFRTPQNQLVFVEYNTGKVSALNLFSPSAVISSGTTTLKGTFTFDLDTGLEGGVSA